MAGPSLYVGIDLGTTNSAAAVFDGEHVELVRSADGSNVTPSAVRIDARGKVTVGARARRYLDREPEDVRTEFKRLMGTPHTLAFPASGQRRKPEELSAEVLRALREDVRTQTGVAPRAAVISVPALFELPQTSATSEAARLAGFTRVEMIQEPVASAIAAGFRAEESSRPWLVYDLGGGTFDASLLESREGLLRVVGHDGDNFLGGRDFDAAIVDWAIEQIAAQTGARLSRGNPAHLPALRRVRAAAEEAKIELSRAGEVDVVIDTLVVDGASVDVCLELDRDALDALVRPLVQRSIDVCTRLLTRHGIRPGPDALSRIVLVGGPTSMPIVRSLVASALEAPFGEGIDPMTVVARGAALYAATAGLDARAQPETPTSPSGVKVWLQYPAMSSDTTPYVVGRLVDVADRARVASVVLERTDGSWRSDPEPIDADGTFGAMVSIAVRVRSELAIHGLDAAGARVALTPSTLAIVHGVTIGDPPLSRSIGIALADDRVRVYFARGSPLPMRRTFTLRTTRTVSPGDSTGALRVPIVQGEFALAHLCRLVGMLEIEATHLAQPLAAGSSLEVTIELDRGGRLEASARVPGSARVFDGVARLAAGIVPPDQLEAQLRDLAQRVVEMRARAFRSGLRAVLTTLAGADAAIQSATRDVEAARGGDLDAAEKVRRALSDLDGLLADAEAELAWPDLDENARFWVAQATVWLGAHGSAQERRVLDDAVVATERARRAKSPGEIQRQLDVIRDLAVNAALRSPGAWEHELDACASAVAEASDPRRATQLVSEGRSAAARGDVAGVERAVRAMWALLPPRKELSDAAHGSGVR